MNVRRKAPALVVGAFLAVIALVGAGNAVSAKPTSAKPTADRVIFFASDGMRPDLMETYAAQGPMPTYATLMATRRPRRQRPASGLPAQHRRRLVHPGDRHLAERARLDEQHVPPHR